MKYNVCVLLGILFGCAYFNFIYKIICRYSNHFAKNALAPLIIIRKYMYL